MTSPPERPVPGGAIGFVGLGRMGMPMSSRLREAGYAVRGFDADPSARALFAAEGDASAASSVAEAAEGAAAVVLMLPDSEAVRQVTLDQGLLAALGRGALLIDMSSSEPTQTRELAQEVARSGRHLVDAPVSGGVSGARAGTLTVMAGGSDAEVEAARPLLETIGSTVLHVGPVGAGHALKSLNNLLGATTLMASIEAVLVGERFGLDPDVMLEAINGSTGRSWSTEHKLPTFVLPRRFESGFGLRLMVKDLRIAAGLARATGAPLRLGGAALELWEAAAAELPEDADHTEIARWIEGRLDD